METVKAEIDWKKFIIKTYIKTGAGEIDFLDFFQYFQEEYKTTGLTNIHADFYRMCRELIRGEYLICETRPVYNKPDMIHEVYILTDKIMELL